MTDKSPEVFGTVTAVGSDGQLTVVLDGGKHGVVDFNEISRQDNVRLETLDRMIGRRMGFMSDGIDPEGRIRLSGRAYEDREYRRVCDAFRTHVRNVYTGKLISVTADGKLAFYRLAQGVVGALHVSSFSLSRVYSFRDINLPRYLTVVVSNIDSRGWLNLSAKPAFGDFEHSIDRLNLADGHIVSGIVSGITMDGAAAIMLAPNLTVLADAGRRVYPGDWVNVRIRRIDHEQHKVKAQLLDRPTAPDRRFDYESWNRPAAELPSYVDLHAFDERIRLNRGAQPAKQAAPDPVETTMDFSVSATRSPFSTFPNERIARETHNAARVQEIYFESRMGYLGEKHLLVAGAIEALKYSSSWQLRRFLYLRDHTLFSERELKSVIDRLIKHDIVGVLRFHSDEGSLLTRVLHPSLNYRALCGKNPCDFSLQDFMESSASRIKMRLAANQLLVGLMNTWEDVSELDTHPFLFSRETNLRLRPRHTLIHDGKRYYLESVRRGMEADLLSKLQRYASFPMADDRPFELLIVAEDAGQFPALVEQIAALRLSFPVQLIDDLSCLPEPTLTPVPNAPISDETVGVARTLLQRLKQRIES